MTKNLTEGPLQDEILSLLTDLNTLDSTSDEYTQVATNLETLYKLKTVDQSSRISKEAWLAAGVNIAGILAVLQYEQTRVIASKALGFIQKIKA